MLLMSTHNVCFYGEMKKYPRIITKYSSLTSPLIVYYTPSRMYSIWEISETYRAGLVCLCLHVRDCFPIISAMILKYLSYWFYAGAGR